MQNSASKFILILICTLLTLQNWAQAPGGVSTNNVFWTKADTGLTIDGAGNVSSWTDSSLNGNDATQLNTAYQPSFNSIFNNYNPALYFDGSNEHLSMNDLINPASNTVTVFAVGTNEGGGDYWHAMVSGQTDSQWTSGGYGLASFNGQVDFGFWVNQWGNKSSSTFIGGPTMSSSILEGSYDGSNINYYRNTALNGSMSFSGSIGDGGSSNIGGGNNTANSHKGHIAEVIIYDNVPSSTDRYKINSYLALKYGITPNRSGINDNFYDSNGTSIFTGNGSYQYWHDIIGIGRDDASQLNQKQSHTTADNLRIYLASLASSNQLNTGSFTNDNSFIVLGRNDEFTSVTIPINPERPAGVVSRLAREWKLQNTNSTAQFNIDLQLNICVDIPPINASDLRLLVDDDGDFTNATIFDSSGGLNISISGNIVTLSGLSTTQFPTNSIKYFTLASINNTTLDNNFHALPVADIHTCDSNQNGFASFNTDLPNIENQVIGSQTGLTVSYYDQSGNTLNLTDPYTNTVAYQETITVRVTNNFECYDETTFNLAVDPIIPFALTLDRLHISNQNDLTVIMTETGITFEYQLDNYNFQPNNYFYDLPAGIHTLTVRDSDSCEIHSINFYITLFEIPSQFTPNGDGYNDYWKIIDSDNQIQSINIFDRYGKIIKQLNPNTLGWDGTLNNVAMPSADYWYVILLNNQEILRGHFSLKR